MFTLLYLKSFIIWVLFRYNNLGKEYSKLHYPALFSSWAERRLFWRILSSLSSSQDEADERDLRQDQSPGELCTQWRTCRIQCRDSPLSQLLSGSATVLSHVEWRESFAFHDLLKYFLTAAWNCVQVFPHKTLVWLRNNILNLTFNTTDRDQKVNDSLSGNTALIKW